MYTKHIKSLEWKGKIMRWRRILLGGVLAIGVVTAMFTWSVDRVETGDKDLPTQVKDYMKWHHINGVALVIIHALSPITRRRKRLWCFLIISIIGIWKKIRITFCIIMLAIAQSLDFSIEKTQFQLRNCAFCLLFHLRLFHLLHLFHHRSTFSRLLLQRLSLLNW